MVVALITKLVAIVFVFLVGAAWLKDYILIPIGLVILWFLIRFIADIFWAGRDGGRW